LLAQQNARNLAKAEFLDKITKNARRLKEEYIKNECIKLAYEINRGTVYYNNRGKCKCVFVKRS
jgi:hypothetical protein